MGETLGKAIVDTGCPCTVAGSVWFESYLNSLSRRDRLSIQFKKSNNRFCFGNGKLYHSKYCATIPIYIERCRHYLGVDVVNCDVPLLLSHQTLRRSKAKIDMAIDVKQRVCFWF